MSDKPSRRFYPRGGARFLAGCSIEKGQKALSVPTVEGIAVGMGVALHEGIGTTESMISTVLRIGDGVIEVADEAGRTISGGNAVVGWDDTRAIQRLCNTPYPAKGLALEIKAITGCRTRLARKAARAAIREVAWWLRYAPPEVCEAAQRALGVCTGGSAVEALDVFLDDLERRAGATEPSGARGPG